MIYLIQILKMFTKSERLKFVALFNNLDDEREELNYMGYESDLVEDLMLSHFGIEFECVDQLNMFTDCIIRHQYKLDKAVKGAKMVGGF